MVRNKLTLPLKNFYWCYLLGPYLWKYKWRSGSTKEVPYLLTNCYTALAVQQHSCSYSYIIIIYCQSHMTFADSILITRPLLLRIILHCHFIGYPGMTVIWISRCRRYSVSRGHPRIIVLLRCCQWTCLDKHGISTKPIKRILSTKTMLSNGYPYTYHIQYIRWIFQDIWDPIWIAHGYRVLFE